MQKHPRQMRPRQFVPPVFVASLVAAVILAPISIFWARIVAVVGVSYAAANIGASVMLGIGEPLLEALLLPFAFATLHISYGLGFLVGLVRFATRWRDRASRWAGHLTLPAA
jgi:hypothetical protein